MDLFEFAGASGAGPDGQAARRKPNVGKAVPKVLSISQLTRKIRMLLEASLGDVWVTGEVSNLRRQASGHTYFTLKDKDSQLSCVLFRSDARSVKFEPQSGMQLRAFGEITVYQARGQYQMIVRKLEAEGAGALQARFEALKRKLHAEGLFAADAKRALPRFPAALAIVTSPTGAAVRDVLHVLTRRAPWVRTIIVPVPVQGAGAHRDIAHALERLGSGEWQGLPAIDAIILCRGGGSIEDLWNFNEEDVARAIHACPIPIISAIGHEIDFTISDFVADLRAPTPSAAAELAVPDRATLLRQLGEWRGLLHARIAHRLEDLRRQTDWHTRGTLVREPERLLRERRLQLDTLADALDQLAREALAKARTRATEGRHQLAQARPDRVLDRRAMRLSALRERLDTAARTRLKDCSFKVAGARQLLRSLGPQAVFNRGFSLTTTADGRPITNAADISPGTEITSRLATGALQSRVTAAEPEQ